MSAHHRPPPPPARRGLASRRQLLGAFAWAGLGVPALGQAQASTGASALARSAAAFSGPLGGVRNGEKGGQLSSGPLPLRGRLPAGLRGTLYRNGPARFELGPTRYEHWFDGDGMVQAFEFVDGRLSHRGRLLRTPKLLAEEAAGRFLYPAFGTALPTLAPVRNADQLNPANINLLAMNDGRELYALWEAGSALQIDPQTLASQGFKVWSPGSQGAPFSAHPRRAADGTLWNFGYAAGSGKLMLYQISAQGRLQREAVISAPQADMVHDFAISEQYLLFLLSPLQLKPGARPVGSLDRYAWQQDQALLLLLVDKTDFSQRQFELPPGGLFHLGNAWQQGGLLHLGYVRHDHLLDSLRALALAPPADLPRPTTEWVQVTLNLASGRVQQTRSGFAGVEFPRFDERRTGLATDYTLMLQNSALAGAQAPGATTLDGEFDSVLALAKGQTQRHLYGPDWVAEEHVLVPPSGPGAPAQGWVLGTAWHRQRGTTTLSVFEAHALAMGPVAQAELPYGLPLGLHGQFVPA